MSFSFRELLKVLRPGAIFVDARERWRALAGTALGVLVTALLCSEVAGAMSLPIWMVPSFGASAMLIFVLPASPLSQPWAVIGGTLLSTLAGQACAMLIGNVPLAAAVAVSASIGLMFAARCVHPPGAAATLVPVLGGIVDFRYDLFPVMAGTVVLVLVGAAYNSLTGRPYPYRRGEPEPRPAVSRFTSADLDAALVHYNQVMPVSREDLESLLHYAEAQAYGRNLGDLRCEAIMSSPVIAVQPDTSLADAWALMRARRIKALPVTGPERRLLGIVTMADFMRHADLGTHEGLGQRLRKLLSRRGKEAAPRQVSQIMSEQVEHVSQAHPVIELVSLFSRGGHHHVPVLDGEGRLAGIVTQTDLVRALYRAVKDVA